MHDGWSVASPEQHGLDPALIGTIGPRFEAWTDANVHAILVAHTSVLVYEQYFTGEDYRWGEGYVGRVAYDVSMKHDLRSVTKSVTSLLVGIAVGRGFIKNVDAPVFSFFPEYGDLRTPEKDRITLRHLLTMSAGLAWNETVPFSNPENTERRMAVAPDPYRYVLERPLVYPPGDVYNYCGGATELLAGILRKESGRPLDEQAKEDLFDPLGISDAQWMHYPNGKPAAASGLKLRPRDLAKIGQLVLDNGIWQGRQIVPSAWIKDSIMPHIKGQEPFFYGYQWWLGRSLLDRREVNWVAGSGFGGQRLFIVPSENIVVAVMAGRYNRDTFTEGATAAIAQAREEAQRLDRASVCPEHIFLGVVGQQQAVAGWVLAQLGVTLKVAREKVESLAGRGKQPVPDVQIPFSLGANRVLSLASNEASRLRHNWLGTEHLLLALFQLHDIPEGVPILDVMQQFRLNVEQVRDLLIEELEVGRRLSSQPEGAQTNNRQLVGGDVGSMVLNHFVLPAVLR